VTAADRQIVDPGKAHGAMQAATADSVAKQAYGASRDVAGTKE
jgi:hypothetical protein